ncbi:uncharacterized protein [Temnothorax nylanderi]|uniref:uncharacterized protein n=1 Tax=Temnothorax nylanderi TaxID=102681 RepID=UPI003A858CA6
MENIQVERWILSFGTKCEKLVFQSFPHYVSKQHDYNLQETLNGFSPITFEDFFNYRAHAHCYICNNIGHGGPKPKEKYQTVVDEEEEEEKEEEEEEEDRENKKAARKELEKRFCEICRKKYSCQKQYENHLASKAHKKKILEQKDKTVATVSRNKECRTTKNVVGFSKERINSICSFTNQFDFSSSFYHRRPLILNGRYMGVHICCLFCDERNQSLEYIMEHMAKSHSFVIPDLKYCVKPKGLLLHLAEKVYFDFQCIGCCDSDLHIFTGKKFKSYNAVRMHMITKGHCHYKISSSDYFNFFDYNNYPDDETAEPESSDVYKAKLPLTPGKFINHALFLKIKRYKQDLATKRALRNSIKNRIKKASLLETGNKLTLQEVYIRTIAP